MNRIKLLLFWGFIVFNIAWAQTPKDTTRVEIIEETLPEFPGGKEAMYAYLNKNIRYPKVDQENMVSGQVIIMFIVDTLGFVTNSEVTKPVSPTIDEEALRVVNSMPQWKPAIQNGKVVRIAMTLPISFKLDENKSSVAESVGIIVGGLLGVAIGVWLYTLL